MMIKLILYPNEELEQSVELESRTLLIGRSDENDLTINDPSVASHHAKLEKRDDEFFVKDLSKQGLLVNGEQVHEAPVSVGSIITIGNVEILFKGETPAALIEPTPEAGALVTTPGASRGYLPTETFIQPAHLESERAIASTLPLASFISGALGPLLLGVGWLLGILLGFISLARIRRFGGLLKDKRMATWGINLGFTWVVLAFVLIAWLSWTSGVGRTIERNEKSARQVLEAICITQYYARYGYFFDQNDNGAPEYGTIEQLQTLHYSAMPDLKRDLPGYELVLVRANEDGFLCYAQPKAYGRTGRMTYSIDQSGVLNGKDLRGDDFADTDRDLPPVGQARSVLDTSGEQIAQDLVEEAKKASTEKDYVRATRIAAATRETFPLTDAVRKELDAVNAEVDPEVVEIRSTEEYNNALALIEGGEIIRALEVLKLAEKNYPTSSYIVKIREQIALIQEKHFEELEAAAKVIYAEAQQLEIAGKFTEAKQRYMKIQEQYTVTTYAEDVEEQIDKLEAKIGEVEAAHYVAQLRALQPERDYIEVVRLVELLQRRYVDTEEFERNYDMIELAENKGRAYSEAVRGVAHWKNQEYESALAFFDKAIGEYPDIQSRLKPYLEECTYVAGSRAYGRGDYRTALEMFIRYRALAPQPNKLHDLYLMRAYYEVGKLDYQQGDFVTAEKNLFICSRRFEKDPEFNYIYASVLMERKNYERAIEYFTRYFNYAGTGADTRYHGPTLRKRGYSRAQLAAILEGEIKDLVLCNAVYRPLLDTEFIRLQEEAAAEADKESEDTDKTNDEDNETDDDDDEDEDEDEDDDDDDITHFSPGNLGAALVAQGGVVLAQTDTSKEKEQPVVRESAVRRILAMIVEVQEAERALQEKRKAAADPKALDRIKIERAQRLEQFLQKRANLEIEIERENVSTAEIIKRLDRSARYLKDGIKDLSAVNALSHRNRELDEVIRRLEYKRQMFSGAYQSLLVAHQQDLRLQKDAYGLLELVIREFGGWSHPRDIGRALQAIYMTKPGSEKIAEGLRRMLKGFDVETDLEVILESGGESGT